MAIVMLEATCALFDRTLADAVNPLTDRWILTVGPIAVQSDGARAEDSL
jgi:hypothetical protein